MEKTKFSIKGLDKEHPAQQEFNNFMQDKLLSVEDAKAEIIRFWGEPSLRSPACLDKLIAAVRREERERAVKIMESSLMFGEQKKKILEEK